MGSWGPGVFENDEASDYLTKLIKELLNKITACISSETNENIFECSAAVLLPSIDVLAVLCAHYGHLVRVILEDIPIDLWREKLLQAYDTEIAYYTEDEDSQIARRQVIVDTFDKFKQHLR